MKKSLETVQRAVVGSTPADKDAVADTEMVALLGQHLEKRRTTHQVPHCFFTFTAPYSMKICCGFGLNSIPLELACRPSATQMQA